MPPGVSEGVRIPFFRVQFLFRLICLGDNRLMGLPPKRKGPERVNKNIGRRRNFCFFIVLI
jgi:hypothetical protein